MVELIQLGRKHGYDKLRETVAQTRATSLARNTRRARQWSSSECTYSRWPTKGFELEEKRFTTVDKRGCVRAGTNWYSTPLKPGQRVMVKLLPLAVVGVAGRPRDGTARALLRPEPVALRREQTTKSCRHGAGRPETNQVRCARMNK